MKRTKINPSSKYLVRIAQTEADYAAAFRLRYNVFVEEFGAQGETVDHHARHEKDSFDPYFDHLILVDPKLDPEDAKHVVGLYRLLPSDKLSETGTFYSEGEFDLSLLKTSGRRLLELGRSCIHPDHRNRPAIFYLWSALTEYVAEKNIEILFGAASLHGTQMTRLGPALAYLHQKYLAPEHLRVRAHGDHSIFIELDSPDIPNKVAAVAQIPDLIKAYLRYGGFIGEGAYIDLNFNTTDVCLVMDTRMIDLENRQAYFKRWIGA